jgi:hypothetical protein
MWPLVGSDSHELFVDSFQRSLWHLYYFTWLVVHSIGLPWTLVILVIHSRGFLSTQLDSHGLFSFLMWSLLIVLTTTNNSIGCSYFSSDLSGSSPTPRLFHVVPVACCDYHGLLISFDSFTWLVVFIRFIHVACSPPDRTPRDFRFVGLFYSSSSRKHSTFRTFVV